MPRRKTTVGVVGPTSGGLSTQASPSRPAAPRAFQPPPGSVAFLSAEPFIDVIALLNTQGARVTGGGPRHEIVERSLRTSVPEYVGHDPLRMSVAVILDGWRTATSVEATLRDLRRLATLQPGERHTPLVQLSGPVPHTDRVWTIDGPFEEDDDPKAVRDARGRLLRQALTVNLLERVRDSQLADSIARSRRTGSGARNGPRYTNVRAGENDLGDVSKRLYDTRRRASDLARANGLSVGSRVRRSQRLRVP